MQAQVIIAAFKNRHLGLRLGARFKCRKQTRNIAVHDLRLQSKGCGRHDNGFVTVANLVKCGNEIPQRFTGSRASLHQQMPLELESLSNMGCHKSLPLTSLTARCLNHLVKQTKHRLGPR